MDMPKFREFTKSDMKEINNLFQNYLFYKNLPSGAKYFECSHCDSNFMIGFPQRILTDEEYELYTSQHNDERRCPKCGATCIVKNVGKAKSCKNLREEQRVVAIHRINENYVQAIARIAVKEYSEYCHRPKVSFLSHNQSNYVFRPNSAEQYRREYYGFHKTKTAREPFLPKMGMSYFTVPDNSYTVIGVKELARSFLRYNRLNEYIEHYTDKRVARNCTVIEPPMMAYLCRYCEYPQIEILQRLGFWDYIENIVEAGLKSHPYVNWKANDLCGFFKMGKQDFNLFREYGGDLEILKMKKEISKVTGKDDMRTVLKWCDQLPRRRMCSYFEEVSKRHQELPIYEKIKYLSKQANKARITCENAKTQFFDYLDMASKLKYDLKNDVVLWPKNLVQAHDTTTEVYNAYLAQIKEKENKEREAKAKNKMKEYKKLYCFSDENFLIIVPTTVEEIVKEGKEQHHCVGGYAARHFEGKLAICFLRSQDKPNEALYTIEMHDKTVKQIQGYKNSRPLTPEAKLFFEKWKSWVKSGSKRNKSGQPILQKIKAEITA